LNDPQYRNLFVERLKKINQEQVNQSYDPIGFVFVHSDYPLSSVDSPENERGDLYNIFLSLDSYNEVHEKKNIKLEGVTSYNFLYLRPDQRVTAASLKQKIHLSPSKKGILLEVSSGYFWKFRTNKPYTSRELFNLRFDRSKVKGDLQEWLYDRIHDIYEESDCDDPSRNPIDKAKRRELWHEAALLFRTYHQKAIHINHLSPGIDPATLPMIKPDTINNNILQIMTLYDGPGSIRLRS
jgi:hypothetical protein